MVKWGKGCYFVTITVSGTPKLVFCAAANRGHTRALTGAAGYQPSHGTPAFHGSNPLTKFCLSGKQSQAPAGGREIDVGAACNMVR